MTSPDQERWLKVKERLRADVGEDIFQSWFARMDLERAEDQTAYLSVPTRFLKSWIQSHYMDRVLNCWQSEHPDVQKIEVSVRSAVIRTAPPKGKPPELIEPHRDVRQIGHDGMPRWQAPTRLLVIELWRRQPGQAASEFEYPYIPRTRGPF